MSRSVKKLRLNDNSGFASKWNDLLEEIERRTLRVVTPLFIKEDNAGTTLSLREIWRHATGGGGGETGPCPFEVTIEKNPDPDPDYSLYIRPGTINSLVPSGILTARTYTAGSLVYVKAGCTTDGKSVTGATITVDGTAPAANVANAGAGAGTLDICLAVVSSNTVYKTLGWCGSIRVVLAQVFLEDKASPAIGESLYNRWYRWNVGAEA